MRIKNNCLIVLLFFSIPLLLKGQISFPSAGNDTVIVYETVTVYDTVFVYDTVRIAGDIGLQFIEPRHYDLNILQFDTLHKKANLILISKDRTATIPLNGIILNENIKNLESMKKLNFFGVMLFAFQSMVMAQSNFGISAGGGAWWANGNYWLANTEFSPTFNIGTYFQLPISNHFRLNSGLHYHFLFSNYSYKLQLVYTVDGETYSEIIQLGDEASASNYHQLSIPLKLGYQIGNIQPFLGLEYSYRISEKWLNEKMNLFGIILGVDYKISEKLSFALNYNYGLTKEYEFKGNYSDLLPELAGGKSGEYDVFWKSSRLDLTINYSLKKNKSVE